MDEQGKQFFTHSEIQRYGDGKVTVETIDTTRHFEHNHWISQVVSLVGNINIIFQPQIFELWCHLSTTTNHKLKHMTTTLSIDQTVSVKSVKPLFLLVSPSFYHHFPPVIASCRPTQQPRPIPGTIDAATIPGSIAIAPPLCRISPGRLQQIEIWSVLGNFDRIKMGMNGWTFLFFLNPRQIGSPTETQNKNGGLTISDGDLCKNKWSKQRRWGFQWSSAKFWFRGTSTGNHGSLTSSPWFPVIFPFNSVTEKAQHQLSYEKVANNQWA